MWSGPRTARITDFFVGACYALYADEIALTDVRGALAIGCVVLAASWGHRHMLLFGAIPLGYAILYLAKRLPMRWWDRAGDSSYGVYLYNWPVCYLLAEFGFVHRLGMHGFVLVSIAVCTCFGFASWHGVESHALRAKDWRPGRPQPGARRRFSTRPAPVRRGRRSPRESISTAGS